MKLKNKLNDQNSNIASGFLFVMVFLCSCDIFGRFFIGNGILGTEELMELMQLVVVFLGIPYAAARKDHVAVDILYNALPGRLRPILNCFVSFICVATCLLLSWQAVLYGIEIFDSKLTTTIWKIPVFPFQFLTGLALFITALIFLTDFVDSLKLVFPSMKRSQNE